MRRREFLSLVGGAMAAWPLATRAQQAMPVIGFLAAAPQVLEERRMNAFRNGLAESGYIEGQNVSLQYRLAEGQYDRLPSLAADLVQRQVNVIVVPFSTPAAIAARATKTTIPIVFGIADDPVKHLLVESLAHPGGNLTGVSYFAAQLGPKRIGLLRELLPRATRVALLVPGIRVE